MSMSQIIKRWVLHVLHDKGKDRSDALDRYAYRGVLLYSNDWPVARLVHAKGRRWVCLTRTGAAAPTSSGVVGVPYVGNLVHVPCVGAFSQYEGDMLPDDKLHDRLSWLWHAEAQGIIEKAQTWPMVKLLSTGWRQGNKTLQRDMSNVYGRYHAYRDAFDLDWPDFPGRYENALGNALALRSNEYNAPKAVEKRERAAARKEAKQALGMDER